MSCMADQHVQSHFDTDCALLLIPVCAEHLRFTACSRQLFVTFVRATALSRSCDM